jgi:outer membrane lipoprotein-sorting protein
MMFTRHPALRWVLPLGIAAAIAAGTTGAFAAQTSSTLPDRTPEQLIADIAGAQVAGLQGTIVQKADLGLPQLPQIAGLTANGTSFLSLLSGSHTARVWYGGPTKQRVAMLTTLGETDVFRNGTEVWEWDSSTKTATHTTLPSAAATVPPTKMTTDPVALAKELVADLDPSTVITTDSSHKIADRPVYELVFSPKPAAAGDPTSLVGSVWIAIDAATKVPLSVEVYAQGKTSPAFDVSFTSVYFDTPDNANFTFTPPPNSTVKQAAPLTLPTARTKTGSIAADNPTVIGSGWTTVVELHGDSTLAQIEASGGSAAFLKALQPVSGAWGSGKILESRLLTALITADGRVFAGPVEPQVLYDAAAAHK